MLIGNVIARENSYEFTSEKNGHLYIVSDSATAIKLNSGYYSNFDGKPFNSLKKAVEISLAKNIAAMAQYNGVLYFSTYGAGSVKINRNSGTNEILVEKNELQSASGYPKEGDVFYLKTNDGKIVVRFENKKFLNFNLPTRFDKKIYLRPQMTDEVSPESKKITFFIAIGLIVLLVICAILGINKKRNDELNSKYQDILNTANQNLELAISLASSDPDKSRELFKSSEGSLKKINELKITSNKIVDLNDKINSSRQSILGEYNENSNLFLDLSLLSSGFNGDVLAVSEGNLFVLDKNGKKVISVETKTKKSKVVAGPSVIDECMDLASYNNDVYILTQKAIVKVNNQKQEVIQKTWEGDSFIKMFGGNMYVIDKMGMQIYRFQGTNLGFGEKQNWLSSGTTANFSDAKSFTVDGALYVLFSNSKILKYSQGSPQTFRLTGVVPEIGNIDSLYADPNNEYLYLLDRAGKRVVVTDKRGSYKAQYFDDKIGDATNLAVSEIDKKIILLTGEKLLQIEIKHQ